MPTSAGRWQAGDDLGGAALGRGIGALIAASQQRKTEEEEAERRKRGEKAVARLKLSARGIQWKPDHDRMIDSGGTADDVVSMALAGKIRQSESLQRETAAEDSAREASVAISRGQGLLKNPQFQKLTRDDPRRQSIADAALHGTIAQSREAIQELEPPKPEKPEKATDSAMDRAARAEYARDKLPDDAKTRLWVAIGGEMPGSKTFPSPEVVASDYEQQRSLLAKDQTPAEVAKRGPVWPDSTAARVLTSKEVADSARVLTKQLTREKQDVAGQQPQGSGADPLIDALEAELRSLIEEFQRLRSGQ
jgi:hypothetical protein